LSSDVNGGGEPDAVRTDTGIADRKRRSTMYKMNTWNSDRFEN
jgi:hypothetical protein